MFNEEFEADAYDITCRVCPEWEVKNVTPTLAAMHLLNHSDHHDTKALGGPWWAMRVVEGYKGLDAENPVLTPEDGWNRPPAIEGVVSDA